MSYIFDSWLSKYPQLLTLEGSGFANLQSRAHKSTDFTDLTIRCGASEFRAHRVVVCSQSSFFKAACVNECRESMTATIELPEDEPQIVERLIEFCYRSDYANFSADPFLGHGKIFAAATEYGIPRAGLAVMMKYEAAAHNDWDAAKFLLSIPYIYESVPESGVGMRNTAVNCAKSRMKRLTEGEKQYNAWKRTCLDVPEF
ncbi:hypothetical protein G647_05284 [Cladophialophora carrionii CBS 160.54]|uniref:BTB domain-containing protein n=1 Tax=Cladophialophora carrionii CBS 160.54 TaxID=1279043 RepID=V9DBY8_9EURO|nr:uncharacterized protein G647_05284 [Cladophialophora carrionii CBS 160.54]ETI23482.1 hypothetical protein G647_05284 [Cladophialophora carrionii CBS 160.54]